MALRRPFHQIRSGDTKIFFRSILRFVAPSKNITAGQKGAIGARHGISKSQDVAEESSRLEAFGSPVQFAVTEPKKALPAQHGSVLFEQALSVDQQQCRDAE